MTIAERVRRRVSALEAPSVTDDASPREFANPPTNQSQFYRKGRRVLVHLAMLFSDAIALAGSIVVGYAGMTLIRTPTHLVGLPGLFVLLPGYLAGFIILRGDRHDPERFMRSLVADLAGTVQLLALGVIAALGEVDALGGRLDGRVLRVSEAVALAIPAVALVPLFRSATLRLLDRHRFWRPRVIVVGSGWLVDSVVGRLGRSGEAVVVGVVDNQRAQPGILGSTRDLAQLCYLCQVDRVLVVPSAEGSRETLAALEELGSSVAVSIIPEYFQLLNFRSRVEDLAGLPIVHAKPASLSFAAGLAKRTFDLLVSVILIALLTPFWIVVAVLIKRDSPGPIFFRQERLGAQRKPFSILKFRTMCADAEERRNEVESLNEHPGTPMFKARNDPRLTNFGRKLRQRHIDELPQLLNVLRGDMSLVGPRPFPTAQCEKLAPRRFSVRPGMTGLWQVSGRSDLAYEDLLYLDTIYVSSWSFWWDMRILIQTPKVFMDRAGDGSPAERKQMKRTGRDG